MPTMEKIEQIKKPEINIDELMSVINNITWKERHEFSYNGSHFLLLLDNEEETDSISDGAEYHQSTAIRGWDIYILNTLSGEARDRRLFHEILECNLKDQGFFDDAHDLAREEEEKAFGQRKKDIN